MWQKYLIKPLVASVLCIGFAFSGYAQDQDLSNVDDTVSRHLTHPNRAPLLLLEAERTNFMALDLAPANAGQQIAARLNDAVIRLGSVVDRHRPNASQGSPDKAKTSVRSIFAQVDALTNVLTQSRVRNLGALGLHRIEAIQAVVEIFTPALTQHFKEIVTTNQRVASFNPNKRNKRASQAQHEEYVSIMNAYEKQALALKRVVDDASAALEERRARLVSRRIDSLDEEERAAVNDILAYLDDIAITLKDLYTSFSWQVPQYVVFQELEPEAVEKPVFLFFGSKIVKENRTLSDYSNALEEVVRATGETLEAYAIAMDQLLEIYADVHYMGPALRSSMRVFIQASKAFVQDSIAKAGLQPTEWNSIKVTMINTIDSETIDSVNDLAFAVEEVAVEVSRARARRGDDEYREQTQEAIDRLYDRE